MKITVWTLPNCVQCDQTKKTLNKMGIEYEEKALMDNPEQVEIFRQQGFVAAPIVTTDRKTWSGFRLDKIKSLGHFIFGENHK